MKKGSKFNVADGAVVTVKIPYPRSWHPNELATRVSSVDWKIWQRRGIGDGCEADGEGKQCQVVRYVGDYSAFASC